MTHNKWHMTVQSENVFELGGKTIKFVCTTADDLV